jgi:hypothetical protein
LDFASRGDGKVKISKAWFTKLKTHYELRQKAITEAISKTQKEFWDKQAKLDNKANQKRSEQFYADLNREGENLMKEYDVNLTEACRQLGIEKPGATARPNKNFQATITNAGWYNVDRAVWDATITRTTLNYTYPNSGKTAEIKYLPMSVQIAKANSYDKVLVYLLPDKLNSFMRMKQAGDVFEEKLNELMAYNLVCIAYKGESAFYYMQNNIEAKAYTNIVMEPIHIKKLNDKLAELKKHDHISAMEKELKYQNFEVKEKIRENKIDSINNLKERIQKVIFSCEANASLDTLEYFKILLKSKLNSNQIDSLIRFKTTQMTTGEGKINLFFEIKDKHFMLTFDEDFTTYSYYYIFRKGKKSIYFEMISGEGFGNGNFYNKAHARIFKYDNECKCFKDITKSLLYPMASKFDSNGRIRRYECLKVQDFYSSKLTNSYINEAKEVIFAGLTENYNIEFYIDPSAIRNVKSIVPDYSYLLILKGDEYVFEKLYLNKEN